MADDLDGLTLAEGKAALKITNEDHNDAVAGWITAASRRLDTLVGPVVRRAITAETYDGGQCTIFLRSYPVAAVTSVVEYVDSTATLLTAETNALKPASAYMIDTRTGELTRRSGNADTRFAVGRKNVEVTYVAGRATTTATIDEKYKRALAIMLDNFWRPHQGAGTETFGAAENPLLIPTFAVPRAVLELLADELHHTVA